MRLTKLLPISLLLLLLLPLATSAAPGKPAAPTAPQDPAAVSAAGTLPPGLPDHFSLGLSSQPDAIGWMTATNIPWDARYQYLSAGVNTGYGWSTWNEPRGQFATYYMDASRNAGYLPVFTYYTMLQSLPAAGGDEASKDYNNLNNPQTMAAYYDDFALLMQKAAAFGDPVLVHVEPDMWGYMQQRVRQGSNDAATISASVASSGYAAVSQFPNTVQGFAWALQHLRSTIAPNVILAIHASAWADGRDVGIDTDPSLDVDGIALHTSNFLNSAGMTNNPSGARSWDLVFIDPSDRDAAYYAQWDGGAHWLDETNATLPNFDRYRRFVSGINMGTNRRVMLWQIPLGNTIMRSMNNTSGHWQDNRVQYFLGGNAPHLQSWIDAGVVGLLFGAGQGDQTFNSDHTGDGITNPNPINGNNVSATVADDDGGYMRDRGAAYYARGPLALPGGAAATATPTTPANTATRTATTVVGTATPTRTVPPGSTATSTATRTATRTATVSATSTRTVPPDSTATSTPTRAPATATRTADSTPTARPCGNYTDVSTTYWAAEYIRLIGCRGIISGYADGSFHPDQNTTRAQLMKIVVLGMGWSTTSPGAQRYSDVRPSDWFFPFVQVASARGVIGGYSDGTFRPYAETTRGQIAKILVSASGWAVLSPARATFRDVPVGSTYFGYVETAYSRGIISGYGAEFRPNNSATRAQISKMLSLTLATK